MKKSSIFPAVVIGLSLIAATDSILWTSNWIGLINSLIGVAGGILYFRKDQNYRQLINVWIYAQFILITKSVIDADTAERVELPVFDLTQFLKFKFGFSAGFNQTSYSIGFNFVPLLYLYAFKKLQTSDLVGEELNLSLYRDNDILRAALPQSADVIDTIDFGTNSDWLLIQLSKPIVYNEKSHAYALIKGRDDVPIVPGETGQMAHLRLADSVEQAKKNQSLDSFQFIDWVFVS